jgi:hypothetical protein
MLKIFVFSTAISFALLCLSNCSEKSSSDSNSLYVKCLRPEGKFVVLANSNDNDNTEEPLVEAERFALLTNSGGKTHVHLDEISLNCAATAPSEFEISHAVDGDSLKLNESYPRGLAKCNCNSSLDLTIESVGDSIKYLVYIYENAGEYQSIFPVIYK